FELAWRYGAPNGFLQETPARSSRDGDAPLARRARPAPLREHFGRRLEALGRAHEDDPQRVSADAVAERGPAAGREAHGGLLLRRRRRAPSRIRSRAVKRLTARSSLRPASLRSPDRSRTPGSGG